MPKLDYHSPTPHPPNPRRTGMTVLFFIHALCALVFLSPLFIGKLGLNPNPVAWGRLSAAAGMLTFLICPITYPILSLFLK
jgi:hypothetical protein